jgi:hypothetical protein
MPETSSGMQSEERSRGARTPSGAKPRASRGVRMEFFNHEQNEFSRMGSGSVIVFQGMDRQALGVPRFRHLCGS